MCKLNIFCHVRREGWISFRKISYFDVALQFDFYLLFSLYKLKMMCIYSTPSVPRMAKGDTVRGRVVAAGAHVEATEIRIISEFSARNSNLNNQILTSRR